MKTCYIFGAAEGLPHNFTKKDNDLVIAADKGYMHIQKLGIDPDVILGDFDSLGYIPKGKEIITHPERKDYTDTLLAIKLGLEKGFKFFKLYGCAGKRFDHTLANIQSLSFIANNGGLGYMYGNDFTAIVIKDSSISFKKNKKGCISVFSLSDKSEEVSISGLSYELSNAELTSSFPIGVSNEFVGKDSTITVKNGLLLIILHSQEI